MIRPDSAPPLLMTVGQKARLLELLATQLQYPALAQRRGWEGVVLMELRLEANGDISRLQLGGHATYP